MLGTQSNSVRGKQDKKREPNHRAPGEGRVDTPEAERMWRRLSVPGGKPGKRWTRQEGPRLLPLQGSTATGIRKVPKATCSEDVLIHREECGAGYNNPPGQEAPRTRPAQRALPLGIPGRARGPEGWLQVPEPPPCPSTGRPPHLLPATPETQDRLPLCQKQRACGKRSRRRVWLRWGSRMEDVLPRLAGEDGLSQRRPFELAALSAQRPRPPRHTSGCTGLPRLPELRPGPRRGDTHTLSQRARNPRARE